MAWIVTFCNARLGFVSHCQDGPTEVCLLANTKNLGQVSGSVLILNGCHGEPGIGEGKECE